MRIGWPYQLDSSDIFEFGDADSALSNNTVIGTTYLADGTSRPKNKVRDNGIH
jgi:hypothetical protein